MYIYIYIYTYVYKTVMFYNRPRRRVPQRDDAPGLVAGEHYMIL